MRTVYLALALLLVAPVLRADDPVDVARARSLRLAGRYGDAEAELQKASDKDAEAAVEKLELLLETGRYDRVGKVAAPFRGAPRIDVLLAESLTARGRLDEAEELLVGVIGKDPANERARFALGAIHRERGDRAKAVAAYEWFFDHYAMNDIEDPEALTLIAAATVRLAELQPDVEMDFHVTMKLLDSVTKEHPEYLPAYAEKGNLYISVYQDADAKKWFEKALKLNPRYPPALYGLALQSAFRFNELGGVEKCKEALLTNRNHFEAKEFIARARMGDSQYEEATKLIDEILAVNPSRKPARALAASIHFLQGDRDGFKSREAGLLAEDPKFAALYMELVFALEQQRRFEEASTWAKKAVEADPDDFVAWWTLGRNLVHLAKETEAREALAKSKALDPFAHYWGNPTRENMEKVLGHLEEFVETRTPNFVYKAHVGENEILTKYYHRFMERSWEQLTKKYDFEPEGPILTEIFHIHADFAARTIGLPGIGALGACFGKVITLDSPSSRPPGQFTWASTAHHEFAHVMTLQLSKGRVPRWFTEGLSVYEERKHSKWWYRDLDRKLFDAYMNDGLPEILKFNSWFRGGDVLFAYYLGGMMCEFLEEEFGFEKIVEMLVAYGEEKQTAAVLSDVLGITAEEYDRRFSAWAGEFVKDFRIVPRWSKKTLEAMKARAEDDPKDLEALVTVAWAHTQRGNTVDAMTWLGKALKVSGDDPRVILLRAELARRSKRTDKAKEWYLQFFEKGERDAFAHLHLAKLLEEEGDFEGAVAHYEAGRECFPSYAGAGNAYLELSRLKSGEGDLAGGMKELEGFVELANTDIPNRLKLADYYEGRGDWPRLAEILTQVVQIYPLGEKSTMPVHVRLARAHARLSDPESAVLEYEVALELGLPSEKEAEVRVELAEVYLLLGRTGDARHQAGAALELSPDYEPAKALLEKMRER